MKLYATSACVRGSGTSRLGDLHETVYVWATDEAGVIEQLRQHRRYRYDSIQRPSIEVADPRRYGHRAVNPELVTVEVS